MRYEDIPEIIEDFEDSVSSFIFEDTQIEVGQDGAIELANLKDQKICSESVIRGVLEVIPEKNPVDSGPFVRTTGEGKIRVY